MNYKHKPETKAELRTIIKDEMIRQGTNGIPNLDANLNNIDTSLIKDFSYLFSQIEPIFPLEKNNKTVPHGFYEDYVLQDCNPIIDLWNTINVEDYSYMFCCNRRFNRNINGWNTQNGVNFSYMFKGCKSIPIPQNKGAGVSSITHNWEMFYNTEAYNQPLNNWIMSNAVDISFMFEGTGAFNQNLNNWDVRNVLYAIGTFEYAQAFDEANIKNWRLPKGCDVRYMLEHTRTKNIKELEARGR